MDKFKITDKSNDRMFFSMLPHIVLNHSTSTDQALYMQMKRYAGEETSGTCWASKKTLKEKMKIGHKSLEKSLNYLISKGWIKCLGKKPVDTKGGEQFVYEYSIENIWKENFNEYNKGTPKRDPLSESKPRVSQKEAKGVLKVAKGGCFQDTTNNHTKEEPVKEYSNSKELPIYLDKFKSINVFYKKFFANTTERKAMNTLLEEVNRKLLDFVMDNMEEMLKDKYCPRFSKPTVLLRKWADISIYIAQKVNPVKKSMGVISAIK